MVQNHNPNKNDILIKNSFINHKRHFIIFDSILNLKLLMPSNRIKNFKKPCCGIFPIDRINEQRFFSKIFKNGTSLKYYN